MLINPCCDKKIAEKSECKKNLLCRNLKDRPQKTKKKYCQSQKSQNDQSVINKSDNYHSLDFAVFYYHDVCILLISISNAVYRNRPQT